MFVKTTRRKRGDNVYTYLSLVEAVREGGKMRHRTLVRLGEAGALAATGQLDRIIAALRAHAEGTWLAGDELEAGGAAAIGGMAAAAIYWRRLGLDHHFIRVGGGVEWPLADAVLAMVAGRLLAPSSKRRLPEWVGEDVVMPEGFRVPELHHYYRAVDAVAGAKADTEVHLYARLTDLTNLDLRLVCYDLTSTYFEGETRPRGRFASRAFGYSRDHRSDRPQVVIGLLCTGDGIPIAHHVFAGSTADVSTLPGVLADLQERFGVGKVCLVADRGLISADNLAAVEAGGFDHLLATRLHNNAEVAAALQAATAPDASWIPVPEAGSAACEVDHDGRRYVVVMSLERWRRDVTRTAELVKRTETELLALEDRVRAGRLKDKAKIGAAAGRILERSGVARLFDTEVGEGRFLYHYDEAAFHYEQQLLAGRYVLTTSLDPEAASTPRWSTTTGACWRWSRAFGCSRTSSSCARSTTGPKTGSAATSPSACWRSSSRLSWRTTCGPPTSAIPTSPNSSSHPGGPCASSSASARCASKRVPPPSISSPGAQPSSPASSPPSASTPRPGIEPASPPPPDQPAHRHVGETLPRHAPPTRSFPATLSKSGQTPAGRASGL